MLELEAVPIAEFHRSFMGLSTALYMRSLISIDSVDLLPSSQFICFAFRYLRLFTYLFTRKMEELLWLQQHQPFVSPRRSR
jgi:hypothetical protein